MGYFPNGCAGDDYQERYCFRCANWDDDKGCAVWLVHLVYNYDALDDDTLRDLLNLFIPRKPEETRNGECTMFRRSEG